MFTKCHSPRRFEPIHFEKAVSEVEKIMIIYSRYNALLLLTLLFHLGAVFVDHNFAVLEGPSPREQQDPKTLLSFCLFFSAVCIYIAILKS